MRVQSKQAKVALATTDAKAYYELVRTLEARAVPFLSLQPGEPVPLNVDTVITTRLDLPRVRHDRIILYEDGVEKTIDRALQLSGETQEVNRLILGIDPGRTVGVALVADGRLVQSTSHSSLEDALATIKGRVCAISPKQITVKIGKSSLVPLSFVDTVRRELGDRIELELIGEENTTRRARRLKVKRKERDQAAAVEIAYRQKPDSP